MSAWETVWVVLGMIAGLVLWVWLGRRSEKVALTDKVRDLLKTDVRFGLTKRDAARELRALVAIDGHRMPKHVRDAANVWLAEHGDEP